MKDEIVLTGVAAACVWLATVACGEDPSSKTSGSQRTPSLSWNSSRLAKIWDAIIAQPVPAHPPRRPSLWFRRFRALKHSLRQTLSKEELREVAASCATMPDDLQGTDYSSTLYAAIFSLLGDVGDREGLVALLAARYEESVYPNGYATEAYVAALGVEEVLVATDTYTKGATFRLDVQRAMMHGYSEASVVGKKDAPLVKRAAEWFDNHRHDPDIGGAFIVEPILIVTDAYSRSKIPAVRKAIAEALRRAFSGLGVAGKSDDEFIANAVKWYGDHKDQIEVNLGYGGQPGIESTCPLFKLEDSGQERGAEEGNSGDRKRGHH